MLTRRLPLLGIAAAFLLGACSSSGATTTAVTPAPVTQPATTTSAAPTTVAPITSAATTAVVNNATVTLVSSALVAQTGGKLAPTDATCIATGLLSKYDLSQLAALQKGPVSPDVAAATSAIIAGCVGADRAAEVVALLATPA